VQASTSSAVASGVSFSVTGVEPTCRYSFRGPDRRRGVVRSVGDFGIVAIVSRLIGEQERLAKYADHATAFLDVARETSQHSEHENIAD
jgi:hypothetical protein